jgi:Immunoglobulin I-set domain
MNICLRALKLASAGLLLSFMAACGSGGGGDTSTTLPPAVAAPTITVAPTAAAVTAGQPATFSVVAAGVGLNYQWLRNDVAVVGATSAVYNLPTTAVSDNGARFRVQVTNSAGGALSPAVNLAVAAVNGPPAISVQPASVTVGELSPAQFSVTAIGTGTLAYQWRLNGVDIPGANATLYSPPRLNTRVAAGATESPAGTYSVSVSNANGAVNSADAILTARRAAPVILVQPVDVRVANGTFPKYTVEFSGSPQLTFQWQRDGVDIPDTLITVTEPTGSFTYEIRTVNFATDNGKTFSLRIRNSLGEVTSRAALLTITP